MLFLTTNLQTSTLYHGPDQFEQGVLAALQNAAADLDITVQPTFHPRAFPDIRANGFGVEAKYSKRDTWHAVGNSVFEGMRDPDVERIYVMFGKVGGDLPEARWGKYEDCVTHVRVSNSPRFVIDMEGDQSLFDKLKVAYGDFAGLDDAGKMEHIRGYWRDRLPPGEHLWWLDPGHTLPLNVRLYTHLSAVEKRVYRAEAALLCPQVCKGSRARRKYEDAAMYLLTHHGVLCPQTRDLFSAGSVAHPFDDSRGRGQNDYIRRALSDIENLMRDAACRLDDALFVEYWGEGCPPDNRISRWLELADGYARGWLPSRSLFLG